MAYFFKHTFLTAVLLAASSLCGLLSAQNTLKGRVSDQKGNPVQNASVVVSASGRSAGTSTDKNGFYAVRNLPAGRATIGVSHILYNPVKRDTDISSHSSSEDFILTENTVVMDEVIISATRAAGTHPFAESTVSKEQLERENFGQNIPVLLGGMPSVVFTTDDGAGFGYSSMRIRGSDASRVNVTINDIPLNDPESHSVFWVNMPDLASSAADIQVQRGAGTSTNGPGAFGGSVNIQTTRPREKAGADLTYNVGSFGTQKFSADFSSGMMNKHYEISGRFSRAYSDGYIERAFSDMSSYFLSAGYFDRRTTIKVLGFGGKQRTYQAWNGVDAETMKTNRRFNSAGAIYDDNWENIIGYYDNETDNYQQDHLQLIANRRMGHFTANVVLHYTFGRGYYENYKQDASLSRYHIGPVIINGQEIKYGDVIPQKWLYNHFYGGTAYVSYNREKITTTLSGSYNKFDNNHYGKVIWAQYMGDTPVGNLFYDNNTTKTDGNVFLKTEYRPADGLSLYLDLQYRTISLEMKGTEDKNGVLDIERDYSFFNPKVGASYSIGSGHRVYASYSRASKEPNRSDFTDSPEAPKPEYLDDFEFGYGFEGRNIKASANVYYMNYKDQLVPTGELNNTGYAIRMNVDKSYRLGVELQGEYTPVKWFTWSLNATFSDNVIKGLRMSDDTVKDTKIAFSPSVVAANLFSFRPVQPMRIDFSSRYVGKQYMSNNNIPESELDGYFVSNIGLSYDFRRGKILPAFTLRGQVNNVFNEMYVSNGAIYGTDAYYFPQAGTNFMLGVDIKF